MTQYNVNSVRALHAKAHAAGMVAGSNAQPTPMTVVQADALTGRPLPGATRYHVSEGACGFAWVSFKGNTSFGRAMKAAGLASKDYPTGLCVWVGEFGQSVERKERYARAYAGVLREAGIDCWPGSRLD